MSKMFVLAVISMGFLFAVQMHSPSSTTAAGGDTKDTQNPLLPIIRRFQLFRSSNNADTQEEQPLQELALGKFRIFATQQQSQQFLVQTQDANANAPPPTPTFQMRIAHTDAIDKSIFSSNLLFKNRFC